MIGHIEGISFDSGPNTARCLACGKHPILLTDPWEPCEDQPEASRLVDDGYFAVTPEDVAESVRQASATEAADSAVRRARP